MEEALFFIFDCERRVEFHNSIQFFHIKSQTIFSVKNDFLFPNREHYSGETFNGCVVIKQGGIPENIFNKGEIK